MDTPKYFAMVASLFMLVSCATAPAPTNDATAGVEFVHPGERLSVAPAPAPAQLSPAISDAEARTVIGRMSLALKNRQAEAMIADYRALFGAGKVDSAFLARFTSGNNVEAMKYEYNKGYRFLGVIPGEAIEKNVFKATVVSQNLNNMQQSPQHYRVTLARDGNQVVIVKDERM